MANLSTAAPLLAAALTTLAGGSSSPPPPLDEGDFFNASATSPSTSEEDLDVAGYEAFMDGSRYVVQRVLVPLVLAVGVVGNTVTIVVLTRRQMRSSTNNYLTALAISDLLYLVFVFSLSVKHHPGIEHPHHWFYFHYFRYALWLTDASSSTSIWLTVTFTIERYIAVCHPIKGKVYCTESRAMVVIVVVYVLCFTLTASTPHEWVVVEARNNVTGNPYLDIRYSDLGNNVTYRKAFYWFSAVFFILLPLILLSVFNSFLIYVVKQSRAQRRKMTNQRLERDSHSQSQENKITIMLIAVVLLALVCLMPTAVLLVYSSFKKTEPRSKAYFIERGLGNIFNLLTAINAACNFVLYCAMSDKYRRTFLRTFCSRWYRQPSPLHSWMATAYSNVEDGSPRFSRVSSMRMSRRSSHRSSGSGSPRGSPPHGVRGHSGGRHPGHYLTVPSSPRAHTPALLAPPAHAEDAPASRPLLRKVTSVPGQDDPDLRVSETAAAASLLNGAPSLSQRTPRASSQGPLRRLAKRLASLGARRSGATSSQLAGTHIVITCQQPSQDEQTAL